MIPDDVVYRQAGLPIFQNKVYSTVHAARSAPTGDVELVQSAASGLVHNKYFDPTRLAYDADYQNEQAHSAAFRRHLDQVLNVVSAHFKGGDLGVEVGCGKGYFFELMCATGANVYGFDPAYEGSNPRIQRRYFEAGATPAPPEYVVLRHVLEHISSPWRFLDELKTSCSVQAKIYIEVPCFDWIVDNNAFYDIFYEHVNYFTVDVLKNVFTRIIDHGHFFGGQYLFFVADLQSFRIPHHFHGDRFQRLNLSQYISQVLDKRRAIDRKALIWGAGAKGITFSNILSTHGVAVEALIDINPAKQGHFSAGLGLPIIDPSGALTLARGADVFVANPVYLQEIHHSLQGIGANLIPIA